MGTDLACSYATFVAENMAAGVYKFTFHNAKRSGYWKRRGSPGTNDALCYLNLMLTKRSEMVVPKHLITSMSRRLQHLSKLCSSVLIAGDVSSSNLSSVMRKVAQSQNLPSPLAQALSNSHSPTDSFLVQSLVPCMAKQVETQPLPLRLCRPLQKSRPKMKTSARPAWTGAGGPSFDDAEENAVPRVRHKPSAQEWCLQGEPEHSSKPTANRGQSSHMSSSFSLEPARTSVRNRQPDPRNASYNRNACGPGGGDNSLLVNTFGDLWRTHRDSDDVPKLARYKGDHVQKWCLQTDRTTSMSSRRTESANPRVHKSQAAFSTSQMGRQSPSAGLQSSKSGHSKERAFMGFAKTSMPAKYAGHPKVPR